MKLTKQEIESGEIKKINVFSIDKTNYFNITYVINTISYSIKFQNNRTLNNDELNAEIFNFLLQTEKKQPERIYDISNILNFSNLIGQPVTEPRKP